MADILTERTVTRSMEGMADTVMDIITTKKKNPAKYKEEMYV